LSGTIIINDASLPFSNAQDCNENLEVFFKIVSLATEKKIEFHRADDIEGNWNAYIYANGFEFGKWINEIQDMDFKLLVKTVIANVKSPLVSPEIYNQDNIIYSLASDENIEVKALGYASTIRAKSVSFSSYRHWKSSIISILKTCDELGELTQENFDVSNIYSLDQIEGHIQELTEINQSNKGYLISLEQMGNEDFPNLKFCLTALKNLRSSVVTSQDYTVIVDVLNRLNNSIVNSGDEEELKRISGLDISKESRETMQCKKHSRKRYFIHPELGKVLFESHIKNFSNGKRMHILADYKEKTIAIGFFGLHLSTVNFP